MKYNMKISPVDDCVWLNEEATLMIDGDTPEEAMGAAMILDSHSQLAEENAKLREVLQLITITNGWKATTKFNDIARIYKLLNQLKEQQNEQAN